MEYLYVFSPNAGKYGPGKTPYLETFHAVWGLMWFDKGWDGGSNLSFDLWDLNELQKIMNLEITAPKKCEYNSDSCWGDQLSDKCFIITDIEVTKTSRNHKPCFEHISQSCFQKNGWYFCKGITQVGYFRSSHAQVFLVKGVLKICSKFTGENLCRSVILIKLLCNFIEIAFRHGCSPVSLLHILRSTFLKNTSERLLLNICNNTEMWPLHK